MRAKILILSLVLSHFVIIAQESKEVAQKTLKSTVLIVCKDKNMQMLSIGSGCVIADEFVATNVHVIENAKYVYVNGQKSNGYVAIDKFNDLVILKVPNLNITPLQFSNKNIEIGEKIYVIGNPNGLTGTFTDGLISGFRNFDKRELTQISAPISPGSSGGPVVNSNAEIIGIAVGGIINGENLNFCIPVKFLSSLKNKIGELVNFNIQGHPEKNLKSIYDNIKSGIIIKNIDLCYDCDPITPNSITFFNNTNNPVINIRVFFIIKDKTGFPVDTYEQTFLKERLYATYYKMDSGKITKNLVIQKQTSDEIGSNYVLLPKLGKRIDMKHKFSIKLKYGEKIEARILDFDILDE